MHSEINTIPYNDPTAHIITATAMLAAPISMWIRVAPIITVLVGTAGLVWYALLFSKEIYHWYKRYRKTHPKD